MGSKKKSLQKQASLFRKNYPEQYDTFAFMCRRLAEVIRRTGSPECTVGLDKDGKLYETANS